jgi:hypothetical protein
VEVAAEVAKPEAEHSGYRTSIGEPTFFEELLSNTDEQQVAYAQDFLARAQDAGYVVEWGSSSFLVKYPNPSGSSLLVSLFVVNRYGGFYLMTTERQLAKIGVDSDLGIQYARRMAKVIPGAQPGVGAKSCLRNYMKLPSVGPVAGEVLKTVGWFTEAIEDAFMLS